MRSNPGLDQRPVVKKTEIAHLKTRELADSGQLATKSHVSIGHVCRASEVTATTGRAQPLAHCTHCLSNVVTMRPNVLPSNVRTEDLIAVLISIKDQAGFVCVAAAAELLGAEKNAELQRHVEAR